MVIVTGRIGMAALHMSPVEKHIYQTHGNDTSVNVLYLLSAWNSVSERRFLSLYCNTDMAILRASDVKFEDALQMTFKMLTTDNFK
jgi:hypothetical protein